MLCNVAPSGGGVVSLDRSRRTPASRSQWLPSSGRRSRPVAACYDGLQGPAIPWSLHLPWNAAAATAVTAVAAAAAAGPRGLGPCRVRVNAAAVAAPPRPWRGGRRRRAPPLPRDCGRTEQHRRRRPGMSATPPLRHPGAPTGILLSAEPVATSPSPMTTSSTASGRPRRHPGR